MDLIERATILHYHRHRIQAFGDGTIGALGWRSPDSQRLRFEAIATAADFSGSTVLDLGCGHGDLKPFLDERFRSVSYVGIDHVPEFIAVAQARYRDAPRTWFFERDLSTGTLPPADYVVASGALNYRSSDPDFYFAAIRRMAQAARRAVIFNVLDAAKFVDHPLLVGHEPDEVIAFCESLSSSVRVIRGYLADDVTICIDLEGSAVRHDQ